MPDELHCNYSFKNNDEREVEKFVGIEIFTSSEINGFGGEYKNNYKDFIVKEIVKIGKTLGIKDDTLSPTFSKKSGDKYTTFNLVKINKETFKAIKDIGKALNIPIRLIYFSGIKDKCSISVQKVSILGDHIEKLRKLRLRDFFFRYIIPTRKPVKLGGNWGNNFTIVIRNIDKNKFLNKNLNEIIQKLTKYGFPNYYGLQRFGTFRPNSHIIGRHILENNYELAFHEFVSTTYSTESPDLQLVRGNLQKDGSLENAYKNFPKSLNYERIMIEHLINNPGDYKGSFDTLTPHLNSLLISAFQSYLFNKVISLRVKNGISLFNPVKGDAISILDDDNGNITKVKHIYGGIYDKYLKDAIKLNRAVIIIPLPGYSSKLDEFPFMKTLYEEVFREEDINLKIYENDILLKYNFKGSFRAITVKPIGLNVGDLKDDDIYQGKKKILLEFSLPKGTYATMLLRELIK